MHGDDLKDYSVNDLLVLLKKYYLFIPIDQVSPNLHKAISATYSEILARLEQTPQQPTGGSVDEGYHGHSEDPDQIPF